MTAMPEPSPAVDVIDTKILRALKNDPRASTISLATATGISRNTVQARLNKLETNGVLRSTDRRIDPASLGYPLQAYILTTVAQQRLGAIGSELADIPEVVQVDGLSGVTDLLVHVVAHDANDLYRIAGRVLDVTGVEKTTTALVMRKMVEFRLTPLLRRAGEPA